MRKTTVVNKRTTKSKYVYIGRGSVFGNRYHIGKDGDREEVIRKYRLWFYGQLDDPVFKKAVMELRGKALGCYCAPLDCHGDIIAEYLNNLEDDDG